jgi:rod shape determining protein RodA
MEKSIWAKYDWLLLAIYLALVIFGWINLYAVGYEKGVTSIGLFSLSTSTGKQFLWIAGACGLFVFSLFFDTQFYRSLAYVFYGLSIILLAATLVWGVKVGGHSSWFQWRGIQLQPTEFVKLTCALAVAKRLDNIAAKLNQFKTQLGVLLLILIPISFILLQGDVGSALVFSVFIVVIYREGFPIILLLVGISLVSIFILNILLPTTYLVISSLGIGLMLIGTGRKNAKRIFTILSITLAIIGFIEVFDWVEKHVLKPHHQHRLKVLVDPNADPLGIGWNVTQSKIAIGSGGFWGKGFLKGTQTKYGFVPEQRKDFIFCTIGEEYGWVGATVFIIVFMALVLRTLYIAERQRTRFARVYGYGVASILFFHFFVNIGMTIGVLPVIGIPLPFISYGGSSLWAFSMMLFILLKFDSERNKYVSWKAMAIDLE